MVRHHGKHFEATSKEGTQHFMTFLEQCQSASIDISPDKAMPSRSEKKLERCDVCPHGCFYREPKKQNIIDYFILNTKCQINVNREEIKRAQNATTRKMESNATLCFLLIKH